MDDVEEEDLMVVMGWKARTGVRDVIGIKFVQIYGQDRVQVFLVFFISGHETFGLLSSGPMKEEEKRQGEVL